MCFCFPVLACCLFFEGKCLCVAVDRLSDVVFHKVAVLGRGHVAENQDRRGNAVFSELDSLLDGCGCKIINLVFQIGCYRNRKAKAHLAVDTGMTRIGFQVTEHDADEAAKIADLPHIELEGMFTHFSCADQEDKTYCSMQMEKYDKMTVLLAERGVTIPLRHICNSAGIMEFDDHRFEMVRSGIITYGIYPSEEVKKERLDLIPALSWKSHVIHVKEVGPGIGVSYGATYVTEKPMTRIATVSAGYADGYPRALSNQGCVLIHGKKAPIIGRICMDQMMVDVTDIPDVQVEDVVTLVGTDGDETITIEEIANPAARFDYEMLCDISSRVTRVYK